MQITCNELITYVAVIRIINVRIDTALYIAGKYNAHLYQSKGYILPRILMCNS